MKPKLILFVSLCILSSAFGLGDFHFGSEDVHVEVGPLSSAPRPIRGAIFLETKVSELDLTKYNMSKGILQSTEHESIFEEQTKPLIQTADERQRVKEVVEFFDQDLSNDEALSLLQPIKVAHKPTSRRRLRVRSNPRLESDARARAFFAANPEKYDYTDDLTGTYICLQNAISTPDNKLRNIYILVKLLGEGEDGITYIGSDIDRSGIFIVIKALKFESKYFRGDPSFFITSAREEAEKNLIKGDLVGYAIAAEDQPEAFLGLHFHRGRPLAHHIADNVDKWTYREYSLIARRMSRTIEEFHNKGLVHRDLHSGNILVVGKDADGVPSAFEIIDMGRAMIMDKSRTDFLAYQLRLDDYMDFVQIGLKYYVQMYAQEKSLDMYQQFNDMVIHLRRDILDPERPFTEISQNEPEPLHLTRTTYKHMKIVAKALIMGLQKETDKQKFLEAVNNLREQNIEVQIVEDTRFQVAGNQAIGFFGNGQRLIAEAFMNNMRDDIHLQLGFRCGVLHCTILEDLKERNRLAAARNKATKVVSSLWNTPQKDTRRQPMVEPLEDGAKSAFTSY